VKSGKKLVWSKGVAILQQIPTPTSTPTPAPTPAPTPTPTLAFDPTKPKQGDSCVRNSGDVIGYKPNLELVVLMCNQFDDKYFPRPGAQQVDQTTGKIVLGPTPALSAEYTTNLAILQTAFASVRNYLNPNPNISVKTEIDPSLASGNIYVQRIADSQDNVLRAMGGLLNPSTSFLSVIASSQQFVIYAYARAESLWGTTVGNLARSISQTLSQCTAECAFASIDDGKVRFPVLTYVNPRSTLDSKELGAHETFHIVQNALDSQPENLPCWIHEGQASFIGSAFADPNEPFASTLATIKAFGGMHSAGSNLSKIESPMGWNGGHGNCGGVGEYQVGRIANAYLVGKYGWEKNLEFLRTMNMQPADGISWKSNFQRVFGQSVPDFYSECQPFVEWFFQNF
jgi:hypothetical protein